MPDFSPDEQRRYGRQTILPHVGPEGQRRLRGARVLLVGVGGLGSPAALYLAAAGVGTLGLVDFDVVDASNLHRQILHGTAAVGTSKLDSARARLADANPHVAVETHETRLTAANALDIIQRYDVVLDGTDNFATRYLVNDACVLLGVPNVHGAIAQLAGQASVFCTADGPCYRCLFPEPPPPGLVPNCAEAGVLGVLPGLVGTIQATETLKLLLGIGDSLAGRLLLVDALGMTFRTVRVPRDPACPACGTRAITTLRDYDAYCGTPAPSTSPADDAVMEVPPVVLAARLAAGDDVALIDVREPAEWAQGRIHGARLVPLGTLGDAISTLDASREIVVYCRSGMRSAHAARQLRAAGFRATSLAGGIVRWDEDVH